MKALIKISILSVLLSTVCGCVGGSYEIRLPPPEALNPVFLRYKELPGQKVFVVAVDQTGQWAFGYDHSRTNLQEAAQNAAVKCDKARKKHQVFAKAKLFAINNEVVYYDRK
jgi:hypothetical protein